MTKLERFLNTVERKQVDRLATWLGIPDSAATPALFEYFGVASIEELKERIDDDIYTVELPYHSPVADSIYMAFDFSNNMSGSSDEKRTLTVTGYFADKEEPACVDEFDWPNPELYISPEECCSLINKAPKDQAVMGVLWSAHFQDTCAAFGMENALVTMITNPDMYKAVDEKIVDFYLRANKIFYEATKGKLHAILIGNDMGSQRSLMLSRDMIKEFVMPGTQKLVEQAKSYGLKVIYHSCGAISGIIPDLIDVGVDVIHPIQALAEGMKPEYLKETFGTKVSFCGGVDAQNLLVNGTPADVVKKVRELRHLFPTGLVISPSHEAILKDIPPENIEALFQTINFD